ncbi:MAG: efflux RND transporter permease subunit, partial [Ignavibacteriaceae bacterium]|nr:efflux RND transporter permease subunit [Ignavibacteriaceae bacterium]
NEEEFGQIIIRTNPDGSQLRLKDVARIELGTLLYNQIGRNNGKPAATIAVFQLPGSNAIAVAEDLKKLMDELAISFPPGMEY